MKDIIKDSPYKKIIDEMLDAEQKNYEECVWSMVKIRAEQIREQLRQSKTGIQWQSIKSAPKDGTPIVIITPNKNQCVVYWNSLNDRWEINCSNVPGGLPLGYDAQPTHWHKLKEKPNE